ncbi:PQQ-binding-like beta-propeller repeat protein [Streptomyces sp. NRRL B-24572]|uniref:outer membrane protein assembly factor BamB family protein n=1 Tax=Streptomyces sp. NRRL B-24572 TaxID=1962156 RepID=UPI000A37E31A|nr:PQQ-binding-like beta-propeller repeat protein [Streptomyces sp. NRRL B-24572]
MAAGSGTNGERGGRGEPWTGWRRGLGCSTVALVALGLLFGLVYVFAGDSGYWPGSSVKTAWESPYDRRASDSAGSDHDRPDPGDQAWLDGDTLARGRYDGVTAYDVRSGKKRWEYVVPGRADVCATSPAAGDRVVLLAYGEKEKSCGTAVAIDLADGRELWKVSAKAGRYYSLATGGGLGLFPEGGVVRAVDLRTGAPRWTAGFPKGCTPGEAGLAQRQAVVSLDCGAEEKLAALDPADGTVRWVVPLDPRRGVSTDLGVAVLSADPPVVSLVETVGEVKTVLSFGADGRPAAWIDRVGDYGTIEEVAVADGRLFAIASYQGSQSTWERIVAFDLDTGDQAWRVDAGSADFGALDVRGGRVTTVDLDRKYGDSLIVLDAATGDEEEDRAFRTRVGSGYEGELDALFAVGDRVAVVRWGAGKRPVSVYERW